MESKCKSGVQKLARSLLVMLAIQNKFERCGGRRSGQSGCSVVWFVVWAFVFGGAHIGLHLSLLKLCGASVCAHDAGQNLAQQSAASCTAQAMTRHDGTFAATAGVDGGGGCMLQRDCEA
jgi:hypothetical protein